MTELPGTPSATFTNHTALRAKNPISQDAPPARAGTNIPISSAGYATQRTSITSGVTRKLTIKASGLTIPMWYAMSGAAKAQQSRFAAAASFSSSFTRSVS